MKRSKYIYKGFTLIELLVVITILAIISVVAYTNLSSSTDKAKNSKKLSDISSIETGLQTFFQEKNYYPMPSQYAAKNVWGYNSGSTASNTATFSGSKNGDQILTVTAASIKGGGKVFASGVAIQIGAKGTIDSEVLSKQYLSQDLADPSISNIKVGDTGTFEDYGIGEYIYGVYTKSGSTTVWDATCKKGSAYNIAITLKDEQKGYLTKLTGNFDKNICVNCPDSLIGSGTVSLIDGSSALTVTSTGADQNVPYPIDGF